LLILPGVGGHFEATLRIAPHGHETTKPVRLCSETLFISNFAGYLGRFILQFPSANHENIQQTRQFQFSFCARRIDIADHCKMLILSDDFGIHFAFVDGVIKQGVQT
jgi:hypothetical protein